MLRSLVGSEMCIRDSYEILLPYVKKALDGLDGKTPTIKVIRGVLCGDQVAPLSEAQNLIRIGLRDVVPSWESTMKHIFKVCIPSLHTNTKFLLLHNALPVMSNVAKWNRWQNRQRAKCASCNSVETLLHPFCVQLILRPQNAFGQLSRTFCQKACLWKDL